MPKHGEAHRFVRAPGYDGAASPTLKTAAPKPEN
jgi:hypothetical protein